MDISFTEHADYQELRKRLSAERLFRRTPIQHFVSALLATSLYIGIFISIFYIPPIMAVAGGALLAFPMLWLGFLGHDIAHGQVFKLRKIQTATSVFLWNLVCGISARLWEENHSAHHQHTNVAGKDPDLHMPFIFSDIQDRNSTKAQQVLSPILRAHQHVYFFILFPLVYNSYVVHSVPRMLDIDEGQRKSWELFLYCVHFISFFSVVFLALGMLWGLLFTLVHAFVLGTIMSLVFAPNHKGMPILEPGERVTYRTQIVGTRNIHPSILIDFLYGGLNYQIEHHLFPYMPRFRLARARRVVRDFCEEYGIPYHETTPLQSLGEVYRSLKRMSR